MALHLKGTLHFKIRFNTMHGDSGLYWRIIIDEQEYLAAALQCGVATFSDASFDERANAVKYHIAGVCHEFYIDDDQNAFLK